jgi:hypothetical protein
VKTEQTATTKAEKHAAKVEPAEIVKQAEKLSPAKNETKKLQQELPITIRQSIKPNMPPPRRSRGISH